MYHFSNKQMGEPCQFKTTFDLFNKILFLTLSMMKMNKLFCIGLFLLTIAFQSRAQQQSTPIEVNKGFSTNFIQNGKKLTPKQLLEITKVSPKAYQVMQKAKTNNDWASVIGFIGGGFIGWPCGTALAGGDPEWALAGIGAGLIAVSIPFSAAYIKHTKNAVNIYNKDLPQPELSQAKFDFGLTPNGIGVRLTF